MSLQKASGERFGDRIDLSVRKPLGERIQGGKHLDHIAEGTEADHQDRPRM